MAQMFYATPCDSCCQDITVDDVEKASVTVMRRTTGPPHSISAILPRKSVLSISRTILRKINLPVQLNCATGRSLKSREIKNIINSDQMRMKRQSCAMALKQQAMLDH